MSSFSIWWIKITCLKLPKLRNCVVGAVVLLSLSGLTVHFKIIESAAFGFIKFRSQLSIKKQFLGTKEQLHQNTFFVSDAHDNCFSCTAFLCNILKIPKTFSVFNKKREFLTQVFGCGKYINITFSYMETEGLQIKYLIGFI